MELAQAVSQTPGGTVVSETHIDGEEGRNPYGRFTRGVVVQVGEPVTLEADTIAEVHAGMTTGAVLSNGSHTVPLGRAGPKNSRALIR